MSDHALQALQRFPEPERSAAYDQGLGPIVGLLTEAGLPVIVENTGGMCMVAAIYAGPSRDCPDCQAPMDYNADPEGYWSRWYCSRCEAFHAAEAAWYCSRCEAFHAAEAETTSGADAWVWITVAEDSWAGADTYDAIPEHALRYLMAGYHADEAAPDYEGQVIIQRGTGAQVLAALQGDACQAWI